jgi:hypothetical protein
MQRAGFFGRFITDASVVMPVPLGGWVASKTWRVE